MTRDEHRTVWSSEQGDLRKQPARSRAVQSLPPRQQIVILQRESKGRGGKVVSLVKGLVLSEEDRAALAKQLKQTCGSGGTLRDDVIEIQGDHREKIAAVLRELGYQVKIAGG